MADTDQIELTRQIFAQLTMAFEDAAGLAVEGQASTRTRAELLGLARTLRRQARRAEALAAIVAVLLASHPD